MSTAICERSDIAAAQTGASSALAAGVPRGRPSWSGLLRLSLVAVPVKAYPAQSGAAPSAAAVVRKRRRVTLLIRPSP